jgi:hypothetical protein
LDKAAATTFEKGVKMGGEATGKFDPQGLEHLGPRKTAAVDDSVGRFQRRDFVRGEPSATKPD